MTEQPEQKKIKRMNQSLSHTKLKVDSSSLSLKCNLSLEENQRYELLYVNKKKEKTDDFQRERIAGTVKR
jgi:hypothetical protein